MANHGEVINTCFDVLAYSADTPERRTVMKQRQLGYFGLRSLWSGCVSKNNLPYCNRCFEKACKLSREDIDNKTVPRCGNCCGWRFDGDGRQFNHTEVPEKYPTSEKSDANFNDYPEGRGVPENYVTGQEYVFSWVKRGVTAAVHNIIHGRWTKGSVGAYLEVLGVSDWIINRVKNVWDKKKDGNVGSVEEEAKLIWPELWDMDYNADIFIETPLHLIFHGILDDVVKAMHKFMSEHDMLQGFENLVNRDLSDISELRL